MKYDLTNSHLKYRNSMHRLVNLLITLFLLFKLSPATAGTIPNFDQNITISAVEQPISVFLQELFGQINVPVVVDTKINGKINGSFPKRSGRSIFNEIASSFGLTSYYDGAVVYVYNSNDLSQRILAVSGQVAIRAMRSADELGLIDDRNHLRAARNGGLIISGTRRFIEQIEELVTAVRSSLNDFKPPLSFRVFYLKYAWAQDVTFSFGGREVLVPGVASILKNLVNNTPTTQFVHHDSGSYLPQPMHGTRGALSESSQNTLQNNDRLGLSDNIGLSAHQNTMQVADNQYSDVRISVDPRLNAVVVIDSPERMTYYQALIDALDVEPQMVEIEATIIDINTSKLKELGVNWRSMHTDVELLFGRGDESDLALRPGQDITPLGEGGFASFVLGDTNLFFGRINALVKDGAANIVSRPQVLTLSNVEAIFDTSSTFYVRVAGREDVDLFSISVGTSLRVTPHVFHDNGKEKIKLLVTIDDGQQEEQRVDDIPVVTRSVINTQALLEADESVLIGGLVREATVNGVSRVPLLSDVPLLGSLFKSTEKQEERIERMFLISPRLSIKGMKDREELEKQVGLIKEPHSVDVADYYELQEKAQPDYPKKALNQGLEGYCTVEYTVRRNGKTTDVQLADCPQKVFAAASKKAVKKIKYRAKLSDKKMVDIPNVRTRFVFTLNDQNSSATEG